MVSRPRVSVVVPTYNRAELIPQTIASILAQSYSNFEVIVVDDGSGDNTRGAVDQYLTDTRMRYVFQENAGRASARNHGVALAQGEYVSFLDSDDQYQAESLAAHIQCFAAGPSIGMTIGGYDYATESSTIWESRRPWEEVEALDLKEWLLNCLAMPGSVMVRRDWIERAGGFDPACEIAEDWDLFLQLALRGCPMAWVRQSVCRYRLHEGNSIHNLTKHHRGAIRSLEKVFETATLPPKVAGLRARALAQAHINHARKALSLGHAGEALAGLRTACQLDGSLTLHRQAELWEMMLTPPPEFGSSSTSNSDDFAKQVDEFFPVDWQAVSRAKARIAMRRFFAAQQRGDMIEAEKQMRVGLSHDATWLANRGVISFWVRRVFGNS